MTAISLRQLCEEMRAVERGEYPSRKDLLELIQAHFNEPIIAGDLNIGRIIGYAEDNIDCYAIVMFPAKSYSKKIKIVWEALVAGNYFLDRLKGQNYAKLTTGEDWDDFNRIDQRLESLGVLKQKDFLLQIDHSANRWLDSPPQGNEII